MEGIFTVTLHVADFPLVAFTVIVAVPFSTAVTTPDEDTLATFVFELLHFRVSVVLPGDIVPFNVYVFPLFMETDVLLTDTFVDGTFTVTLQVADLPLVVLTVIVAVPFATAVTTPAEETLAIFVLELLHFMVSVVLLGDMVPFKVYVFPTLMDAEVLFIATLVDGTFTVTLHVAAFPLVVFTVIVALPFATAVTTPAEETFAILVLELLHFRVSVVLPGDMVPFKV